MTGLADYDSRWEKARAEGDESRVYEDQSVLIATDFEGGNGSDIRRLGPDHYAIKLEPEPGQHRYSGRSYYYCFGVRNKRREPGQIRVRLEANNVESANFGHGVKHAVLRRGGAWSQLDPAAVRPVEGDNQVLELTLPLPGANEPDNVLFASDFHWWPYSEYVDYLHTLDGVEVRELGKSYQGRPLYAVEFGPQGAPCIVNMGTPQPSEMGHLCCKAMIDFLRSSNPEAAAIRSQFRVCFVPVTNPDGIVLGYGVSDGQGRFPFFEGELAAQGDPNATPEMKLCWAYLQEQRPWLFWEWHSNNWDRRPGHMLLRYTHDLLDDERKRQLWDDLEDRLLTLPDTYHGNWTSRTEGSYRPSIGYQSIIRLGNISCMIKQHDKFPIEKSRQHAVDCLKIAAQVYR